MLNPNKKETAVGTGRDHVGTGRDLSLLEKCPVCELLHPRLIHRFIQSEEKDVIDLIKQDVPDWQQKQGVCSRCYDELEAVARQPYRMDGVKAEDFRIKFLDFYIFPLAQRLNADTAYTGKGVTICFIDSGFYLHPDIKDRVIKILDINNDAASEADFLRPSDDAWHGSMTSAVCAGNGSLSDGLYKGLASDARLVLLKVQDANGAITDTSIEKALLWVLRNHEQYNIRILNLSLSGDMAQSLSHSPINQLAERLFNENILVVAAVGNSLDAEIKPPASSPHVIAVGGLDDENKLDGDILLYHSTYGFTEDGYCKPELVSNAIWIPAPILPETETSKRAMALFKALENQERPYDVLQANAQLFQESDLLMYDKSNKIWEDIKMVIWAEKFITPFYMHVDGTSFAAPIVCSLAAQMLEASPALTSRDLRQALFQTAIPVSAYDVARQGYGKIQPRAALYSVLKKEAVSFLEDSPMIDYSNQSVTFYLHLPEAKRTISLTGSFNNWRQNEIMLQPAANNIWYAQISAPPPGQYTYKFFVDNTYWVEDVNNPWRVPDGYTGWNSALEIK